MKFWVVVLLFCLLIFYLVFGRDFVAVEIAALTNIISLVLGILGGILMGLLAAIGFALGAKKSERHLVIVLAGTVGMAIPYLLVSSLFFLFILAIERLGFTKYGIDILEAIFFTSLLLTMVFTFSAVGPYVKERWGSKESEEENELSHSEGE